MTGLPQGWALATLADLGDWSSGGTPSRSNSNYFGGDIPFVKTGDLRDETLTEVAETLSASGLANSSAKIFPAGTLLIAMYGATIGRTARLAFDAATNQACAALLENEANADSIDFVWKYLRSQTETLKAAGKGGAQPNISQTVLKEYPIPLPPVPEQRRIVRKLDTLSARSTTARTHLTAIEKLVERMRGAVLSQALNGRLVVSQIDCGEPTELGNFITGIEQGWSPKCENEPELDPTKWAVLTTTAIQAIDFDCTENKRLPESLSARPNLEVEVGDVLMTRAGPRVRCAVCCYVAETAPRRIFSDKVYRIRLDQSVEPEFFVMVMNAPEMVRALDAIKSGGSESGLNLTQDRLKSLEINLWDRPTQVEVVAEIKRQFAKIDRLAAEAAKALKLLGHLESRILAKAFAGDLVPQDPTDEPAETLLARIRAERLAQPKPRRGRRTKERV